MWESSCRYSPACNGFGEVQGTTFPSGKCFVVIKPFIEQSKRKIISQRLVRSNRRIQTKGHTLNHCHMKARASAISGIC